MIRTGLILAAGEGSRLRDTTPYKPLCPVAGRPLIDRAIESMAAAGMTRVVVSIGYGGDVIAQYLRARDWPVGIETVATDHRQPNGVSALAARDRIGGGSDDGDDNGGAVMVMCDHLCEPNHYRRLAEAGYGDGLTLGVDRRLGHEWVDPDDVTCVGTEGNAIVAIGKGLTPHDCYDTGVFAVGPRFFAALAGLASPSLTEGVRVLAADRAARVVDCSDCDWIDVDDAKALRSAQAWQTSVG